MVCVATLPARRPSKAPWRYAHGKTAAEANGCESPPAGSSGRQSANRHFDGKQLHPRHRLAASSCRRYEVPHSLARRSSQRRRRSHRRQWHRRRRAVGHALAYWRRSNKSDRVGGEARSASDEAGLCRSTSGTHVAVTSDGCDWQRVELHADGQSAPSRHRRWTMHQFAAATCLRGSAADWRLRAGREPAPWRRHNVRRYSCGRSPPPRPRSSASPRAVERHRGEGREANAVAEQRPPTDPRPFRRYVRARRAVELRSWTQVAEAQAERGKSRAGRHSDGDGDGGDAEAARHVRAASAARTTGPGEKVAPGVPAILPPRPAGWRAEQSPRPGPLARLSPRTR